MSRRLFVWIPIAVGFLVCLYVLNGRQTAPKLPPPKLNPEIQLPKRAESNLAVTNIPGIGPIPTDPKELEKLKAKLKRDLTDAFKGAGLFTDPAALKEAQDTGEIAWMMIENRKSLNLALEHIVHSATEPFPPRLIEALGHILRHAEEAQMKLTAATLLYRHGHPAGKEHLLSLINAPTAEKRSRGLVMTFALNREPEAVQGILAAFPQMGPHYDDIQVALGRWREPNLTQMVRQQYAGDPKNWGYALGLSQADDIAAIEPLKVALKTRSSSLSGLTIQAALTHLGAMDSTVWVATMETSFLNRSRIGERALITLLDLAGPSSSRDVAQTLLQACIPLHEEFLAGMESQAKGIREKDPALSNKFPKEPPTAFIKGAAQLLAQWDAKEAVPTLQQVLVTVQKGNRADVYLNESLGLALYRLDPTNWRETLLNAGVPEYHVDRLPALAKLRPIPPEYLPKQVNLKAR
jgi:hypothetical protein